jgi:hypothetical protein
MHYLPMGTFKIDVPKGHRSAAPDKVKGTGGVQPRNRACRDLARRACVGGRSAMMPSRGLAWGGLDVAEKMGIIVLDAFLGAGRP